MAYTITLKRSTNNINFTTISTWVTNGGTFADWVADVPNTTTDGAIGYYYRMEITSNDINDQVSVRRIAGIAGNR
jgi:hypothetical protein